MCVQTHPVALSEAIEKALLPECETWHGSCRRSFSVHALGPCSQHTPSASSLRSHIPTHTAQGLAYDRMACKRIIHTLTTHLQKTHLRPVLMI